MKVPLLLLAVLGAGTLSASLPAEGSTSSPDIAPRKVLSFPVHRQDHDESQRSQSKRRLVKRADDDIDLDTTVYNYSSIAYLIELSLGTPPQTIKTIIDTGSSELWVNPDCTTASSIPQQQECWENGFYDPNNSSSIRVSRVTNDLLYGLGDARIRYVTDHIEVPGSDVQLKDVQFGVATQSTYMSHGILGLSFGNKLNLNYNTFVDELAEQGVINTRAVSIGLGFKNEKEHSGLITFGGLDTKKYMGKLHSSPILGPQLGEELYRYWVTLDSIAATDGSGNKKTYSTESFPVFFDTGATLSYLPTKIVNELAKDIGARYNARLDVNVVPCNLVGTLDFTFGNFTINVDLREFTWELSDGVTCAMGAEGDDDGSFILGASFLRSVYAVFDMETPAIHFAHYANCGSSLQEIPAGKNAAAAFEGECTEEDLIAPGADSASGSGSGGSTDDDDENAASRQHVGATGVWFAAGAVAAGHVLAWLL